MESFAELIKKRRSIRKFTNQLLSPEQVESLLKAVLMAPSSKRSNAWQFVLVENKEMLQKLASCKKNGSTFLETAALAIVVLANPMESDVFSSYQRCESCCFGERSGYSERIFGNAELSEIFA